MVAYRKKEQVMSETKRKNFTGELEVKVALESIRGIKTVNEIGQEFGLIVLIAKKRLNMEVIMKPSWLQWINNFI